MEASCMVGLYKRDQATTYEKDEKMMMMKKMGRHHDGDDDNDAYISESSTSSSFDGSNISKESSSSELLDDDASSSSSSSSSNNGPLYELSELMDQLPVKRGLSRYYQGKSQSFTSLARVTSLEDLAKKESPYQRKLKACRSYGGGLSNFRSYTQPKPTISKKAAKSSMSNLSCLSRKGSFVMGSSKPPLSPVKIN